jgi:peroxiredoxin Q/BCP
METAPSFSLSDQEGVTRLLDQYAGRWLVLYFYPKDDTPGCTTEACSFRDNYHALESKGIALLGVSKDTVSSHKKFAEKYSLNFPLLSDPSHSMIEAYGAWGLKKFMGREFDGILRTTILISPDGKIAKRYPDVNPTQHAAEVIADLAALGA